jgi:hypothetical protein
MVRRGFPEGGLFLNNEVILRPPDGNRAIDIVNPLTLRRSMAMALFRATCQML